MQTIKTDAVKPQIHISWLNALNKEFNAAYFRQLKSFLVEEKKHHSVFPPGQQIFNAFNFTPFEKVKAVIIGQDPYHGPNQAHGLSFSVPNGIKPPPSLLNIYKEINNDLGIPISKCGNLECWAKQGVLLLNATLTVRAKQAGSHQKKGWEIFTDAAIHELSTRRDGLVFLLWGSFAKAKKELIDPKKHHILTSTHPSPFSAHYGFFGCKHFSQCNSILEQQGLQPIDWRIE